MIKDFLRTNLVSKVTRSNSKTQTRPWRTWNLTKSKIHIFSPFFDHWTSFIVYVWMTLDRPSDTTNTKEKKNKNSHWQPSSKQNLCYDNNYRLLYWPWHDPLFFIRLPNIVWWRLVYNVNRRRLLFIENYTGKPVLLPPLNVW